MGNVHGYTRVGGLTPTVCKGTYDNIQLSIPAREITHLHRSALNAGLLFTVSTALREKSKALTCIFLFISNNGKIVEPLPQPTSRTRKHGGLVFNEECKMEELERGEGHLILRQCHIDLKYRRMQDRKHGEFDTDRRWHA